MVAPGKRRIEPDTSSNAPDALIERPALTRDLQGIVHMLTCGSVDDGKSTLVGRLLWEATSLQDDQRQMVIDRARASGNPDRLDYSLLLDGLSAEREQGITIDIAWRYVDWPTRRLVIIDSPGHETYTRNMASGASHADIAVMLVDARHGVKPQTRRHAAILALMGVPRVVLAVNKMDLVDWSEARFREIEREMGEVAAPLDFKQSIAVPVSAREGDNIATLSASMSWYKGPTLVAHLESVPSRGRDDASPFRMPVQTVLRDHQDFRGIAGTITSGTVKVGDAVHEILSGSSARVAQIMTMDRSLPAASAGMAVAVRLDADVDISRGAMLSSAAEAAVRAQRIEAQLIWLADFPLDIDRGFLLRTATDSAPVVALEVVSRLELETFAFSAGTFCQTNDVVTVSIETARPIALDLFSHMRETGSFLLVDPVSGATLAAGIAMALQERRSAIGAARFILTRSLLSAGLCADLTNDESSQREFARRAREAARLLEQAGVSVEVEGATPGEVR